MLCIAIFTLGDTLSFSLQKGDILLFKRPSPYEGGKLEVGFLYQILKNEQIF